MCLAAQAQEPRWEAATPTGGNKQEPIRANRAAPGTGNQAPPGRNPTGNYLEAAIQSNGYAMHPGVVYHLHWAPDGSALQFSPKDTGGGH